MTDIVTKTLSEERASLAVLVEPAPVRGWAVGGKSPMTLAHVVITVSSSASSSQKADCVSEAHGLMRQVLGGELTPFSYVLVEDVSAEA